MMQNLNEKSYADAMDTVHAPTELVDKTKKLADNQFITDGEEIVVETGARERQYIAPQSLVSGVKKYPNKRKRYWKIAVTIGAAAAVFCMVMTVPHTSFAKYVKNVFHGFWSGQREINAYVQTGIYEDEDQHVKMSVEELLSDEMSVSVVVKYEAKDKKGKKWLRNNGLVFGVETFKYSLGVFPTNVVGVGQDVEELEEYRTDTVRCYILNYDGIGSEYMKNCVLRYSLTDHVKETELDTSTNIPVYEYALKAEGQKQLSPFYEPKVIRLTKLSMSVYGQDTGMSVGEEGMDSFSEEFLKADENDKECMRYVQLIKKDGTAVALDLGAGPGSLSKDAEERYQCDCLVVHRSLYMDYVLDRYLYHNNDELKIKAEYGMQVDPEEIVGLSLTNGRGNVIYQFEKLK